MSEVDARVPNISSEKPTCPERHALEISGVELSLIICTARRLHDSTTMHKKKVRKRDVRI